ncbi:MAG TPA: LytTR family DNA-binding domain-containing protein [Longimicrobium sp.]|jgi:two-component system LytT family response regulator
MIDPVRVLIVDDEPLAREGLRALAEQDPTLAVVGECGDGRSAVELIARARPDLVLLDIEMPEMSGFDVIREVGVDQMPFVVFITAYDQFAVQAFEVSAVDYIVKPFTDARFQQSMERAKQAIRAHDRQQLSDLLRLVPAQLAIRAPGKTSFVPFGEITWIEADGAYARVHLQSGRPHVVRETLADLHPRLDPAIFLRAHRSAIVNRNFVREIQTHGRAEYYLVLAGGQRVPLSRRRREAVEESLTGTPWKAD